MSSEPSSPQLVLVTVTGPDTPGITAALTGTVAENDADLVDIEQVVVRGRLILGLLIRVDAETSRGEPVIKDLLFTAKRMGLDLQFRPIDDSGGDERERTPGPGRCYAITAISDRLDARGIHELGKLLARHDVNIETIRRLSDRSLMSLEFIVTLPNKADVAHALRKELIDFSAQHDMDLALQRETLTRRSKRLIVMDMDSTLIRIEIIDELARLHGVEEAVVEITKRAMAGALDFEQSLRERVALLEGLEYTKVMQLARELPLTEGALDLLRVLRTLGYKTGVISGGFTFAANALKQQLGLDYAYANQLEVRDGRLTGRVLEPIVTPQRKADLLDAIAQGEGVGLEQTIAIGDGANDLLMLERAGLGIAFHAKAKLKAAADTSVSAGGLDRILFLLGLRAREVSELLATSS